MSFKNSFRQDFIKQPSFDGDTLASISIDWFPRDPDKEGRVIAEVNLTKQGNTIVKWRDDTDRYYTNKTVFKLIEESKRELLKDYPNLLLAAQGLVE